MATTEQEIQHELAQKAANLNMALRGDGVIPASSYVVQTGNDAGELWTDVAHVEVPARTKRRRVIELGLEQAKIAPAPGETLKVRVLDAESSEVTPVVSEEQPPKLRIG